MQKLVTSWYIWKLAIVRCSINCFIVGGTAYTTTMSGVKWSSLDADQQFMVLLGVSIVVLTNVQAFLDRSIERISQGKLPVATGNTEQFRRDPKTGAAVELEPGKEKQK